MSTDSKLVMSKLIKKDVLPCPNGVLPCLFSLQLQCILYIVGHIEELSIIGLSLLPRPIRIQLLLTLPAVDVCKLEGTPFTADISMNDEIWAVLYRERIPVRIIDHLNIFNPYYAPDLYLKKEATSHKGLYFFVVFSKNGLCRYCRNYNNRYFSDLLFSISSSRFFKHFPRHFPKKYSGAFNICRVYFQQGGFSPLPNRYYSNFIQDYRIPKACQRTSVNQEIITDMTELVDICHAPLKHLFIAPIHFEEDLNATSKLLPKLLESIEYFNINYWGFTYGEDTQGEVLDMILNSPRCIKGLNMKRMSCNCKLDSFSGNILCDDKIQFNVLLPCLTAHPNLTSLTELIISGITVKDLEDKLSLILTHLQQLEILSLGLQKGKQFDGCSNLADLFHRPMFKELRLKGTEPPWSDHIGIIRVPSELLISLFREFFSSPYPVKLSLGIYCRSDDVLSEPLPFNTDQPSKCLELKQCILSSNFTSILPPHLVFKSLMLHRYQGFLQFFANVKSIQVESIIYGAHYRNTINDLCSLINIITAKEWNIFPKYSNDCRPYIEPLCKALSTAVKPGTLHCFGVSHTFISFHLLETVFQILSPAVSPPYFELYIGSGRAGNLLKKDVAKHIYSTWEKYGAIEVKNIKLYDTHYDKVSKILNSFSEFKAYFKF